MNQSNLAHFLAIKHILNNNFKNKSVLKSYCKSEKQLQGSLFPKMTYLKPKNNLRSKIPWKSRKMFQIAENDPSDRVV